MNLHSTFIYATCAIALWVGIYHLVFYFKRPREVVNRSFALCCFTMALYDFISGGLNQSTGFEQALFWQRWQMVPIAVLPFVALNFTYDLLPMKRTKGLWVVGMCLAVLMVVNHLTPAGIDEQVRSLRVNDLLGFQHHEHRVGFGGQLLFIVTTIVMVYLAGLLLKHYRAGKRYLRPMLISMFLFFAFAINDMLMNMWIIESVYLVEFGYLLILYGMSHSLQTKFVDISNSSERLINDLSSAQAQLKLVNDTLEMRIQKRTRELEETSAAREHAERAAQRNQKMKAIGTLAGGMAHDMNNVLTAIMSFGTVLRESFKPSDELYQDVVGILSAAERGRALTRNLLGFARAGKYRKQRLSINKLVQDTEAMLRRMTPKGIEWKLNLKPTLPDVEGDSEQLAQVLINICLNSVEAIEDKGTIEVTTGTMLLPESIAEEESSVTSGRHVQIEIEDTGSGIDPDVKDHIFEPFFTTKGRENGTGLGLSMVYGTMKNHHGCVNVHSDPGKGTTVQLLLPATEFEGTKVITPKPAKPFGHVKNIGTVMIVDDEPLVRQSMRRALLILGYEVLIATNGAEAIDVYRNNRDKVDVIILDLIMPVMSGEEAFYKLKEIDPEVPIMLVSGFSQDGVANELLAAGAYSFTEKPFELDVLSDLVNQSIQS